MKIKFNNPIDPRGRCFVFKPAAALQFKGSFVLTNRNLHDFLALNPDFSGKFVFDLRTKILALAAGEDTPHRSIARSLTEDISRNEMVGAFLDLNRSADGFKIELYGDSGYFGRPSGKELKLVADHLAELFGSAGVAGLSIAH
ncbi:MAG: hypothetical protein KKC80_01860 [Candidatus Margulisbacteria bacterium]|nr:hypothetical protein [Candidatus Margulisiibacteriota bacterium]MBU1616501.1 hypothetical protein [Candidatus Margulisiibacteriota bacterium]MBU1867289.1 hypothetical protein [Candidatus Margulisiibacteriota bacterium]